MMLTIDCTPIPTRLDGELRAELTARNSDGETIHTDQLNVASATSRTRFASAVMKRCDGVERNDLDRQILGVVDKLRSEADAAAHVTDGDSDDDTARGGDGNVAQAAQLVRLADDAELFHTGDTAYATIPVGEHRETWRLTTKGFRQWLAHKFYMVNAKPPNSQAMQDALGVLGARAIFDATERPVAVRCAQHAGVYYLDLADDQWCAVEVTRDGWRVIGDPPVKFVRARGMQALPVPERGGSVDELRGFLNLEDEAGWALIASWLAAAMRPSGPFPVLVLSGEQGSAKSTACRLLRALVDPNAAPLRAEPRNSHDLMIASLNSWIVALDNLSGIKDWLSDGLCRLATGGGFATRELYTDDEEKIFDAMRPVLLNGIDDPATRPDLLDRAVSVTLPAIPENRRRTEAQLWRAFERACPRILGALLDAVAAGMKRLPAVTLPALPRMADFATWAVACEPALGLERGAFLAAYATNRAAATDLAIEASPIGPALVALVQRFGAWSGTARNLLDELETDQHTDEKARKRTDWPNGARSMGSAVRRLAPDLRRAGVNVTFDRESGVKRRRLIILERTCPEPSTSSKPSINTADDPKSPTRDGRTPDANDDQLASTKPATGAVDNPGSDGLDGLDAKEHDHSEPGREVIEL